MIYIGLGSLEDNELLGIEYSATELNVWTPTNMSADYYTAGHPMIPNVFYLNPLQ